MKGPFVKSKNSTNKMMVYLLISLLPIIVFSFYKNGIVLYQHGMISALEMFYPLIFILIGTMASLFTEEVFLYVFKGKRGKELIDNILYGYGIFPGLFLSLVLPVNTPLSILFVGAVVATLIGKMIYGGFGNNVFNPALIGCIFVITCYGTVISTNGGYLNAYELDTIGSATPLTHLSSIEGIGTYDTIIKPFGTIWDFFLGIIPGAMGETSALLCIISFIFLTITGTIKWRIPVIYISTVFIMTMIIGLCNGLGMWYPLFEILSGGLFFGATFMATDPVTSPTTVYGQIIYGLFLGLFTVVFRYLTSYPEGVMTSILLMNMFVFIIDKVSSKLRFKPLLNNYLVFVLILIPLVTAFGISKTYTKSPEEVDSNFGIVSKTNVDSKTIYKVYQKGFGGKINATVTFEFGRIVSIEVTSNNESADRYKLITDANFINSLIKKQDVISEVDTISSATITSSALKKMVMNVLSDFSGVKIEEPAKKQMNILNQIQDGEYVTYDVSIPSFGGLMKIKVVKHGTEVRTFIPYDYKDSCVTESKSNAYYTCPVYMDQGYISSVIVNQDNLDSVDTVSGATYSSSAIKEAMKEIKEEG